MARCIGGHTAHCWRCGGKLAQDFVVCDDPLIEECRCAECGNVLAINGRTIPAMDDQVMAHDGQGRR